MTRDRSTRPRRQPRRHLILGAAALFVTSATTQSPAGAEARSGGGTVRVHANRAWTDTGFYMKGPGQVVQIKAQGAVEASGHGDRRTFYHRVPPEGRWELHAGRPQPLMPSLGLLGRIGNGPVFFVGTGVQFGGGSDGSAAWPVAPGQLYLGINDDIVDDNSGAWSVQISITDFASPAPAASGTWQYESQGGWTGVWTPRGGDQFDASLRGPGGERQSMLEQLSLSGNEFHSHRLSSTDGKLCRLDGALTTDRRMYQGTGSCPGGPSGWWFRITISGTPAPSPAAAAPPPPPPPPPPQTWQYESQGGWTGVWTQRGGDLLDASLRGPNGERQSMVEQLVINGNEFHSHRVSSTDGKLCRLDGALQPDGKTYQGTGSCPGGPSGWWWRIRLP